MENFFGNFSRNFTLFGAHENAQVSLPRVIGKAVDWVVIERHDKFLGTLYYVLDKLAFLTSVTSKAADFTVTLQELFNLHEPDANATIRMDGVVLNPGRRPGRFADAAIILDHEQPYGIVELTGAKAVTEKVLPLGLDSHTVDLGDIVSCFRLPPVASVRPKKGIFNSCRRSPTSDTLLTLRVFLFLPLPGPSQAWAVDGISCRALDWSGYPAECRSARFLPA